MKKSIDNYFQEARTWVDDIYVESIASRNRYRFAFLLSMLLIGLFLICFMILLPLQHTQVVMVHHSDDGTVWSELLQKKRLSVTRSQIESDIVRYVVNRESYSPSDFQHQFSLVNLLSSPEISKHYQQMQSADNPRSPINRFKNRMIRSVRVHNVIFLNTDAKKPLAQVNFTVTVRNRLTGYEKKQSLLALMGWHYQGTPKDPRSKWENWDGFMVTNYSIQQRNV